MNGKRKPMVFLLPALALSLVMCGKGGGDREQARAFEIEKEFTRGPLTFTVKVDPKEITIAQRLSLVLEARCDEAFTVELPEFGEKLEQFGIVDYRAPAPELTDGGTMLYRKTYELEPFLSGEYTIPPMTVRFFKAGEEESPHELESEALTVNVTSILPENVTDLAIREISGPVTMPRRLSPGLIAGIAGLVVLLAGAAALLAWRKRRTVAAAIVKRPAHEVAFDELRALLARNLLDQGEIKLFYLGLSRTLRHYIENRFGLRAPERTTEEFLDDLRRTDELVPSHKGLLREFLEHCDLVKFAEHRPGGEDIQKTFDACKRFITETQAVRGALIMRLDAPWALLVLLIIPLVLLVRLRLTGRGSLRFSSTSHAKQVRRSLRQRLLSLPTLLRVLALIALAFAIARPQEGKEKVRDISKGIAIEMVVDRSSSMAAEMEYGGRNLNRLDVVKRVFEEFVTGERSSLAGRPNDLIGMVSFARYADTVCPLTLAHGALSEFLENVKLVQRQSEDGTAIGDAVALAAARLRTAEETLAAQTTGEGRTFEIKSKIIILLTDGQNNVGRRTPMEAAELAEEWGIKIYAIGVGGDEGLLRQDSLFGSFLVRAGQGVDRKTLETLADKTGGMFRMAGSADALRTIYQEIDEMERSEIETVRYLDYRELFQPFLYGALLLLAVEILLSVTVFRKIP